MDQLEIKVFSGNREPEDAFSVRRSVFLIEQGFTEQEEFDDKDAESIHFVGYLRGAPVAAARVRYFNERAIIERVAVVKEQRRKKYGTRLMQFILGELQSKENITEAYLESQSYAKAFHERLGFEQRGGEFDDLGIPHVAMIKDLS